MAHRRILAAMLGMGVIPSAPALGRSKACRLLGWDTADTDVFRGNLPLNSPYKVNSQVPVFLPLFSTWPLTASSTTYQVAAIFVHGISGAADRAFCHGMWSAMRQFKVSPDKVLVIAPWFGNSSDPAATWGGGVGNAGVWQDNSWPALGGTAAVPGSVDANYTTSADAMDALVAHLRSGIFPNLALISITGFSAGGQFAQRYAVTSGALLAQPPAVPLRVIVGSPDSYAYFDANRPALACRQQDSSQDSTSACGVFEVPPEAANCSWYDRWKYGFGRGLATTAYLSGLANADANAAAAAKAEMMQQFPKKDVRFFAGVQDACACNDATYANAAFCFAKTNESCSPYAANANSSCCDTYPRAAGNLVDSACAAKTQGNNRYQRAVLYVAYLSYTFRNIPGYAPYLTSYTGKHNLTDLVATAAFQEAAFGMPSASLDEVAAAYVAYPGEYLQYFANDERNTSSLTDAVAHCAWLGPDVCGGVTCLNDAGPGTVCSCRWSSTPVHSAHRTDVSYLLYTGADTKTSSTTKTARMPRIPVVNTRTKTASTTTRTTLTKTKSTATRTTSTKTTRTSTTRTRTTATRTTKSTTTRMTRTKTTTGELTTTSTSTPVSTTSGLGGGTFGSTAVATVGAASLLVACLGTGLAMWHRRIQTVAAKQFAFDPEGTEVGYAPGDIEQPPGGTGQDGLTLPDPGSADAHRGSENGADSCPPGPGVVDKPGDATCGEAVNAGESGFVGWQSIFTALQDGSTKLVKGSWLLNHGECLMRHQDLPRDAFWSVAELRDNIHRVEVVALSYAWLDDLHPDPRGEHLAAVRQFLDMRLDGPCSTPLHDVAIFWDFMSLPQRGRSGEARSEEDQAAFERALESVGLWYAHRHVSVWRHPWVPAEVSRPYEARGWPLFETAASAVITGAERLLDLSRLDSGRCEWEAAVQTCALGRRPPMQPADFEEQVGRAAFTHSADRDFVVQKYKQTFHEVLASTEELSYGGLQWADDEACELALVLPFCERLRTLSLDGNNIGARGARCLVAAAAGVPSLELLALRGNPIDEAEAKALQELWVGLGKGAEMLALPTIGGTVCAGQLVFL